MPDDNEPKQPQQPQAQLMFKFHENFESWYANNIQFQPTEWDLRMVFGELDFTQGIVQQHTAMTVSWLQAKLMHYFLTMQLSIYEISHGKIPVPPSVLPVEPQPPTGDLATDPLALEMYEYMKQLRTQFLESLK
jgi:hypothetical protein